VKLPVFVGNRLAQAGKAGVFGVEGETFVQGANRRLLDERRGRQVGLAEMQLENPVHAEGDIGDFPDLGWRYGG
jgi:hypothetical protein